MLPLIDGAGYKLFDTTMIPLTDGAGYKLFGTNMLPHLPLRRWGYFLEEQMIVSEGYFYHISDSFFTDVQDATLIILVLKGSTYSKERASYFFQNAKNARRHRSP